MVRRLGEGGMGSVWLAWDTLLERNVAIKQMRVDPATGAHHPAVSVERVLREARALSRLDHPNIVRVIDIVERAKGPWIVMEYVRGHSLAEWIAERPAMLTEDRIAEIGLTVVDALRAAHERGVIHRDVKPANILIKDTAQPLTSQICLVDFGNAAMEGHDLTTMGNVVGTLPFIAPERFNRTTGEASDLWSLGVTLYQAAERRLPFQRDSALRIYKAIIEEPPDPVSRARLLVPLLSALLEKDPGRRPRPDEVDAMLRRVIEIRRAERLKKSGGPPDDEDTDTKPAGSTGSSAGKRPTHDSEGSDDTGPRQPAPASGFAAIAALSPKEAVAVLRRQGPRQAAVILGRMAAKEPRGAVAVIGAMSDRFAAELLRHTEPAAAVTMLLGLPTGRGARLLVQVSEPSAIDIVETLPARKPKAVQLMRALPAHDVARLLNHASAEHAIALMEPYDRDRTGLVLANMTPRRAAGVLDLMPADPREAAAVLRGLPRVRLGAVLDRMKADRVAEIVKIQPAVASWILGLMGPANARAVIEHMERPR